MSRVSTSLSFQGNAEEAFNFYKSVFGTEFEDNGILRWKDMPHKGGPHPVPESEKNLVMHVELPILGGHRLMGSDVPASMGFHVDQGNNFYIILEPDTRDETKRLFDKLSAGGKVTMELQDMFWGAYYGTCSDKYGVHWMFNCANK